MTGNIVVVADVFAATTNLSYLLSQKIEDLILVNSAIFKKIKKIFPDALIIGESPDPAIKFAASNNPFYIRKINITGRKVLYMTNNGTRVIQLALDRGAAKVYTAGFVNLNAVATFLKLKSLSDIILVPAGEYQLPKWGYSSDHALEDLFCVQVLKTIVEEKKPKLEKKISKARKFILQYYPKRETRKVDLEIIFNVNSLAIVPVCRYKNNDLIHVVKAV